MRSPAIETRELTKRYGEDRGIEDLNLRVERGEIFGLLGPNGAGKTTTIRLLLDLIRPSSGRASVCGFDTRAESVEVRARSGYLPGELSFPPATTARKVLSHLMRLRSREDPDAIESLADRLGLALDREIGELSRGNRQKVGLVAALMHDPEVLILDEPTSGLDPLRQQDVQELIRDRANAGRTVFLSSHALDQVQHVAHRVGIVNDAALIATEDVTTLKQKALKRVEVRFSEPVSADGLGSLTGVRNFRAQDGVWRFEVEGQMAPVIKALGGYPVETMTSEEPELDEIFLSYYGRGADG